MNLRMKKVLFFIFFLILFSLFYKGFVFAEDSTPTPSPSSSPTTSSIAECADKGLTGQACVDFLSAKVSDLKSQEDTLSSQIKVMNNQINLTEARIEATQEQITSLTMDIDTASKKVSNLEQSIDELVGVLANRIVATYEVGTIQPFQILLTSSNVSDFFKRLNYLKIAQEHDKKLIYDTQQAKVDYANQKNIYQDQKKQVEALKTQLVSYTAQLNDQKASKQQLLTDTQGSEANYQRQLERARQELAGFTSFTSAAGATFATFGSGSNGWYYTQRDPQWGGTLLPGSSSSVLLAGCAVTSVAMVCKSYGQGVTPASIVASPNKFIGGDLWNWAFSCDGKTTDWIGSSQDQVRSYVEAGTPVILRLVAPSVSGLHFVVAWKWDGGDFIIHDPYYGPDKKFSDRYSWSQVTTAVVIH
jgi:peptidoglycan hydrolase CwlO-like protein